MKYPMTRLARVIVSLLLILVFVIPIQAHAQTENERHSDSYEAMSDGEYLEISFVKYNTTYTASSRDTSVNSVDVLEYTDWQMRAQYVVVENNGKSVKTRTVTDQCSWGTGSSAKGKLSVDSGGRVSALRGDGGEYTVAATYLPRVDGTAKTLCARINFRVRKLSISDMEPMRCLTFNYLTRDKWSVTQRYLGSYTINEFASIYRHEKSYINNSAGINSATMNHFISAAAGAYWIANSYQGGSYLRGVLFTYDNLCYLALTYVGGRESDYIDGYDALFSEARELYNRAVNDSGKQVTVTGIGLGGTAAKYLSYHTGCRVIAFNARSPLEYCVLNDFKEFCAHYDPNRQTSYVYPDVLRSAESYAREPYYTIERNTGNASGTVQQMIRYSRDYEKAFLAVEDPGVSNRNAYQRMWGRNFFLGHDADDVPNLEPSVTSNYAACVAFGGSGNDTISLTEYREPGYVIGTHLRVAGIIANAMPLCKTLTVSRMVVNGGIDVYNNAGFARTAGDLALDGVGLLPGYWGYTLGYASQGVAIDVAIYELGMLFANGIYPDYNIFVGGAGSDTMRGSLSCDWYVYRPGDGHDEIYDGVGNTPDIVYLMDCDPSRVSFSVVPNEPDMMIIWIDDEAAIDFHIQDTGFMLCYGSPLDSRGSGEGTYFTKESICKALEALEQGDDEGVPEEASAGDEVEWEQANKCVEVACPVDMLINDASGNTVVELCDGTESYVSNEYGVFECTEIEGEYVKTSVLYDSSCSIVLRGNSDGVMDYSAVYLDENGLINQFCSLEDVPVRQGELFGSNEAMDTAILTKRSADGTESTIQYETTLQLDEHELTLSWGQQQQLNAVFSTNSAIKEFDWVSTNPSVATVSTDGVITAVGAGKTDVAVIALDGSDTYDVCTVNVSEEDLSAEDFEVTGLEASYPYTGGPIDVNVAVSYRGMALEEGIDYVTDFTELVEPGSHSVTISGLGRFAQSKTLEYLIVAPQEASSVEEKIEQIAEECRAAGIDDEYEIAVWLHDKLINIANYDFTYTYYGADGVLLHRYGVCNSYALAYKGLLDAFGIQNEFVASDEMDHAWNMVRLDGEWCHVDCTWDDPGFGGLENHSYFGMSDDMIAMDHTWVREDYPSSESNQNYYPIRHGSNVVFGDEDLHALLDDSAANHLEDIECYYVGTDAEYSLLDAYQWWHYRNNWRYGIETYSVSGNGRAARFHLTYTDPWEQPAAFSGRAASPRFVLRGPEGSYDLDDYDENGMILIFGREGCLNTLGLADRLHERLSELRSAGVEVILNIEGSSTPDDIAAFAEEYPSFCYTYEEPLLLKEMRDALGIENGWLTYPCVFFINKHGMITFYSEGYVDDIDGFINEALAISTDCELPPPGPVDESYQGATFRYTGDDNALASMMSDAIAKGRMHIGVMDATGSEDEEAFVDLLYRTVWSLKEHECDFEWPSYYPLYPIIVLNMSYGCHAEVIDEGVEPTCTEGGLSDGSHCEHCGKTLKEREAISPLGHSLIFHEKEPATTSSPGKIAYYSCSDCGEAFLDENGIVKIADAGRTPIFIGNVADSVVTVAEQNYTGRELTPNPMVMLDGKELVAGTDYTVAYADNVEIGIATVAIQGTGSYCGVTSSTFAIVPGTQSIAASDTQVKLGRFVALKATSSDGGALSYSSSDTSVARVDNEGNIIGVGVGKATITVRAGATVNYGETTKEVDVTVNSNSDGWGTLPDGGKVYVRKNRLAQGWLDLGQSKYWFHDDGAMATGWTDVRQGDKVMHYYFNPASGNLVRNTWFTIDDRKYYFRPSGNLATGWATIKDGGVDKKYYFEDDGTLVAGCWRDIDTGQGYEGRYYFRPSGAMATGWATIDGQKYWFRPSGNMATGFADVDDAYKRYFDHDGTMVTGWREIGGSTYYFRASGAMQTGTATIDGQECTFTDKGVRVG